MTDDPVALQAELEEHQRLAFIVEEDEEATAYYAQLDRLVSELWASGVNEKTRRFFAPLLAEIFCGNPGHRQPLARIYATSEGPFLMASIGNDLTSRRGLRSATDAGTSQVVKVRDPWLGAVRLVEDGRGRRIPQSLRGVVPLARPGIEEMLSRWDGDEEEERRLVLLCGRCGRRPVPPFATLMDAAQQGSQLGKPQRVVT